MIAAAIADGSRRTGSKKGWNRAVLARAMDEGVRADFLVSIMAVAGQLAAATDTANWTTRPTWAAIVDNGGVSWSTVGRVLARLQRWGLLGKVATGKGGHQRWKPGHEARNLAAVYVLTVPRRRPVEISEPPTEEVPALQVPISTARGAACRLDALRARPFQAPTAPHVVDGGPPGAPNRPWYARTAKTRRRMVAAELQERLPVLGRVSEAWVASVIRLYVAAGWSASDLHHAVDYRPDGSTWPHSGADGVEKPAHWLAYRLLAWLGDDGVPVASRSQVLHARALAERDRTRQQLASRRLADQGRVRAMSAGAAAAIDDARRAIAAAKFSVNGAPRPGAV